MTNIKQPKATLTRAQARALPILLGSPTVAEGCRRAGISRDRFYDWMKLPAFKIEYERQSRILTQNTLDELRLLGQVGVMALGASLTSSNESIRLSAANRVLDHLSKLQERDDHETRLARLEKIASENARRRTP